MPNPCSPSQKARAVNHLGLRLLPKKWEQAFLLITEVLTGQRQGEVTTALAEAALSAAACVETPEKWVSAANNCAHGMKSFRSTALDNADLFGLYKIWAKGYDDTPFRDLAQLLVKYLTETAPLVNQASDPEKDQRILAIAREYQTEFASRLATLSDGGHWKAQKSFLSRIHEDDWNAFAVAFRLKPKATSTAFSFSVVSPYTGLLISMIEGELGFIGKTGIDFKPELDWHIENKKLSASDPRTSAYYAVAKSHEEFNGGPAVGELSPELGSQGLSESYAAGYFKEMSKPPPVSYQDFADAVMVNTFAPGTLNAFTENHLKIVRFMDANRKYNGRS